MEILGKMEIITDHTLSDTIESDNLMLTEVQLQEIALRIYEYSLAKHTGYSYEDIIAVLRRNCEYYPPFPPISPFRNNPRTTRRRINYRAGERETLDMLIAVANYEAKQDDCRWANSIMADLNYDIILLAPDSDNVKRMCLLVFVVRIINFGEREDKDGPLGMLILRITVNMIQIERMFLY